MPEQQFMTCFLPRPRYFICIHFLGVITACCAELIAWLPATFSLPNRKTGCEKASELHSLPASLSPAAWKCNLPLVWFRCLMIGFAVIFSNSTRTLIRTLTIVLFLSTFPFRAGWAQQNDQEEEASSSESSAPLVH